MRKGALVLLIAALGSLLVYCVYFYCATQPIQAMLTKPEGEMEWLRREFNLTDAQFAKIKALHEAYRPKCDLMCQRIAEANTKLDLLIQNNHALTPEIKAALANRSEIERQCRETMLAHIYSVSAEMNPRSARRYVDKMRPRMIQTPLSSNTAVSRSAD